MALERKGSWLAGFAVLAVTALVILRLAAAVPQEVRSRVAAAFQVRTRAGNIDKKPLRYIKDPNPAWSSIAVKVVDLVLAPWAAAFVRAEDLANLKAARRVSRVEGRLGNQMVTSCSHISCS